jgi:hypothetical protein
LDFGGKTGDTKGHYFGGRFRYEAVSFNACRIETVDADLRQAYDLLSTFGADAGGDS